MEKIEVGKVYANKPEDQAKVTLRRVVRIDRLEVTYVPLNGRDAQKELQCWMSTMKSWAKREASEEEIVQLTEAARPRKPKFIEVGKTYANTYDPNDPNAIHRKVIGKSRGDILWEKVKGRGHQKTGQCWHMTFEDWVKSEVPESVLAEEEPVPVVAQ